MLTTARNALIASLIGVAAVAATTSEGFAQSPPNPPSRFAGTVMLNGTPAPSGTTVSAMIGSTNCGTTTVFSQGGQSRYVLDVVAQDTEHPGCGTVGATVLFMVGGQQASQTGQWANYNLATLDLTAQAAATPTATTPAGTTVPATATATARQSTPLAPSTGSGGASGGGSETWMVMLGALSAAGIAATAIVRRR